MTRDQKVTREIARQRLEAALASIRDGKLPTDAEIIADYRGTDYAAAELERCINEHGYVFEYRADARVLDLDYPTTRYVDGDRVDELESESIPLTAGDIARLDALLGVR